MSDPATNANPVDDLAEEFARRWRDGERPSVEEYVAKYPRWERDIRDIFSAVVLMEELKPRRDDAPPPPREGPAPQRLGEFRIVREIGRGGMGVVYEAEQEALGRRVALKVLPAHLLADAKLRDRFRREAQAAAKLHHTNIVPVFGAGEQDGLCYYIMQLIDGRNLDAALRRAEHSRTDGQAPDSPDGTDSWGGVLEGDLDTPTAPLVTNPPASLPHEPAPPLPGHARAVARIGVQVADALAYAHVQGILHRDVKPSNLLLDGRGTVWVTDFGVAKLADAGNLTQPGDLVGTLRYMPPERFRGVSDARGDIYSLGITLYELLALRPAYPDATPHHLIHLITHEQPPPLRKLVPRVPADLETVVLKATARDPVDRYQTAADLADDLRRFLDDRPVRARRTTAAEHLWRWCRRNRLAASLAATALTLLALVAVVSVVAYLRTAAANREAAAANAEMNKALRAEQTQRGHAEATSALALKALNRIYDRFAPNRIVVTPELPVEGADEEGIEVPAQPVLPKEAAPLLEELLEFYEVLAERGSGYAKLRAQAAEASHRIGDIRQRLGQFDQAAAAYERSIQLYKRLRQESPADSTVRVKLARSYNELGRLHRALQRRDQERSAHAQALATLTEAPPELAKRPEYRYEIARTLYFRATREDGPGRGRPPGPGRGGPRGRGGREVNSIQDAIRILKGLVNEHPSVPDYRHLLACCYRDVPPERFNRGPRPASSPADEAVKIAPNFRSLKDFGSSEAADEAVKILQKLTKDFPDVPDYRYDLAETYAKVDFRRLFRSRDFAAVAKKRLQEALAVSKDLVAEFPNVPHYAASHAQTHHKLGIVLRHTRQLDEAEKSLRRAVSLQSALVKRHPEAVTNGFWLTVMQSSLARVLIDRKQWAEALTLLEPLVQRQDELLKKDQRLGYLRGSLASGYRDLARVLTHLEEHDRAAEARRKAERFWGDRSPGFRDRRRDRR